jgi:hypothetical protein
MFDFLLRIFSFLVATFRGRSCVRLVGAPFAVLPPFPYSRMVSETAAFTPSYPFLRH